MLPVFPFLATYCIRKNISLRTFAKALGVSHRQVSNLWDFKTAISPDDVLLVNRTTELIRELTGNENILSQYLSFEADRLFLKGQDWWQRLLLSSPPDESPRGPLLEVLRLIYFFENRAASQINLVLPCTESIWGRHIADTITCACYRFFAADNLRRRTPRNWKLKPPVFVETGDRGGKITFSADFPDANRLFHHHPQGDLFATLLFYTFLKGIELSWLTRIDCSGLPFKNKDKEFCKYINYKKYRRKETSPMHVRFTLIPPTEIGGIATPYCSTIYVCLDDPFWPSTWCWCVFDPDL